MVKEEFLKLLSNRTGISYEEAKLFYEKFVQRFVRVLKSGQNIRIPGFGEFKVKTRKGRKIIDKRTGTEKVISARNVVSFSPAKILAEKVNVKYGNLKSVVLKSQTQSAESKEVNKFNLTFFESGKGLGLVESGVEDRGYEESKFVSEAIKVPKEAEHVPKVIKAFEGVSESYLSLPDDVNVGSIPYEEIHIEVPVLDIFPKAGVVEASEELKINLTGRVDMPEFNLTEEPRKPEQKKFFDDIPKKGETQMSIEHEEENRHKPGFWIFIIAIFLIFIAGVIFLLNQYGYIHLWGEKEKETDILFKQPEEVIVTAPPSETSKVEIPKIVDEKEVKPTTVAPRVGEVKPKVGKSYVIQVASFQDKRLADAYADHLRKKGYNAFVERTFVEWKGGRWYRVRIGFFDSIEQANEIVRKLKNAEKVERIWISEASKSVSK